MSGFVTYVDGRKKCICVVLHMQTEFLRKFLIFFIFASEKMNSGPMRKEE